MLRGLSRQFQLEKDEHYFNKKKREFNNHRGESKIQEYMQEAKKVLERFYDQKSRHERQLKEYMSECELMDHFKMKIDEMRCQNATFLLEMESLRNTKQS